MAAVHSILLDFSVKKESIVDDASRKRILESILEVLSGFMSGATSDSLPVQQNGSGGDWNFGRFISGNIWVGEREKVLITVRFHVPQGLLTLNLEYLQEEESAQLFSYEVREIMEI